MNVLRAINLGLRGLMELGIILGFGYWGYFVGNSTFLKVLFCVGAPLMGFGFWGLVDFRAFGRLAEYFRLVQELVISGLAAFLLYSIGAQLSGFLLGVLSIVHHALVYILGDTLLK